jgi:hypothetical protein
VKGAILARGGNIRGPKGRGIIRRQRAKIAVHARNANIIFCKIINHLNPPYSFEKINDMIRSQKSRVMLLVANVMQQIKYVAIKINCCSFRP